MWRITSSKRLATRNLSLPQRIYECSLTSPLNGQFSTSTQCRSLPPPPPNQSAGGASEGKEPPKDGGSSSKNSKVFAGVVSGVFVLFGAGYLAAYNDRGRFWVIDKFPASKGLFSSLGFCIDRPLRLVCNDDAVKALIEPHKIKPIPDGPNPTSMSEVADKTVSGLNITKAIANDTSRRDAELKKHVERICEPCHVKDSGQKMELKQLSASCGCPSTPSSGSSCTTKAQCDKKTADRETMSFIAPAEDGAKLLLSNWHNPTAADLEERTRIDEERHRQKMKDKERRDADFIKKQKEKIEHKAAQELEKEKQQQHEQKLAAEAFMNKVQKNQEFETTASKRISEVMEIADHAMKMNKHAIDICKGHAAKLKEAMDANTEEEALKLWPIVHQLNDTKQRDVEEAHRIQQEAEEIIVAYKGFVEAAKADPDTCKNQSLPTYRKQINEVSYNVTSVRDKLAAQETVLETMKHYYHMLKKDKDDFFKELDAIMPEVKWGEKGFDLPVEGLNAMLAHAHRRILQLKHQLMEQHLLENQRLEDALCEQKKMDMKEASQKLGQELDKQYDELQLEKERELMAQSRKFDSELKMKLARQASEHQDHLQDMLALQQKKLMQQFDLALRERLIHERHVFIDQISQHTAQVEGLERALEERADMGKVITHVQGLMSGAMCLMHAVAHDVDCQGEEYQIIKIDEQLKRCFMAGEDSPFVQAVLHTIPNKAAERGIYSMSSLEQRFNNVYKQCRKSPAYPENGNIMSNSVAWVKHQLASTPKPKEIASCEFDNPEGMNQSELLEQAKYFMDKKCVHEAVRCMVQLTGELRLKAQDWIEEARLVLETRQAAEVLMAYANSKGMGTIF